jgi:hypothetical protein
MRSNQPAMARDVTSPSGVVIGSGWAVVGETASASGADFGPARDRREPDDFWAVLVGSIDGLLRACHGIFEFTDDPICVLRLGLRPAGGPRTLADGTAIGYGEPVGGLHLWNEHLRQYSGDGPDVGWACDMRRRVVRSMQLLANYIEREPGWQSVRAFRGAVNLSPRLGTIQIRRLSSRLGFEVVEPSLTVARRLHFMGDCFNTWALTRAFNRAALPRQRFLRGRCELWISRDGLLARYGNVAGGAACTGLKRLR